MFLQIDQNPKGQHRIKQLMVYSKMYTQIIIMLLSLVTFSYKTFKLRDKN